MRIASLEKEFTEACNKHPHLKLLESQWRFDKELISKALQNISAIFPHYSRHDASHSKQIIINIERLLGGRIKYLTATDMWLILEAAYSHDIGMVITHKQIQDMDTPEFYDFVQEVANQSENELNSFATEWLGDRATLPNGANAHIFFNKYIQLIAEWYRRKHPQNSAKVVRNPYAEIGLDSPRNELLPKRLFGALAEICNAHGSSFEEVIKLPFSEAGMATEDCHPRYVAFLLRMGDLLDVDDNRFCPVMMRMCGPGLPKNSHAHYEKHQSIKHFRLDSERIEIEVVCPSPESYEIAYDWFKWLEEEHHKQSQSWHEIVPSKKLGGLPTLSSPIISIEDPFLIIENGKKPRFDVDQESVLNLLRSTGLYSEKNESIREILQNAVDSTLQAIWLKNSSEIKKLTPTDHELQTIYDQHRIAVNFAQDPVNQDCFCLSVTDQGVGVSEEDLRFILKVGSSSKNKRKSKLLQEMPLWFRPSGSFGIGLQSIYLLSESFTMTTKSIYSHKALEITFFSDKDKSVVIKKLPPDAASYGVTVNVKIKITEFPDTISLNYGIKGFDAVLNGYDFTKPGSSLRGYDELKILSAIHEFNVGSPIKLNSGGVQLTQKYDNSFFSAAKNIILRDIAFSYDDRPSIRTLFRGQCFSGVSPNVELIRCVADYYGYVASDFLTYNREKVLPRARKKASADFTSSVLEYIDSEFQNLLAINKPCAAAFYFFHADGVENCLKYESHLMDFIVHDCSGENLSLKNILSKIKNKDISRIEVEDEGSMLPAASDPRSIRLKSNSAQTTLSLIKLLSTKDGMFWQECKEESVQHSACIWSDCDIQPVSNEIFKKIISSGADYFEIGNRLLFPAWGEYKDLSLSVDIAWGRSHPHEAFEKNCLVLPCKFEFDSPAKIEFDETFIDWVYKSRKFPLVTREQIHLLYSKLIAHLKSL
jgi:hypothetical protein